MSSRTLAATLVSCLLLAGAATRPASGSDRLAPAPPLASAAPIPAFVPNLGQLPPPVRFQLRGSPSTIWVTDSELWLSRVGPEGGNHLRLTFPGAMPGACWAAAEPAGGRHSSFLGDHPATWRRGLPRWASLRLTGAAAELSVRATGTGLALAVAVEPGVPADLDALRMRVEGAEALRVEDGELVAATAAGLVPLPPLVSRPGGRLLPRIDGDLVTWSSGAPARASSPAATVPSAPGHLLIGTYLGGGSVDSGRGVAVGADGSIYVAGYTLSVDFPTTPGAFDEDLAGTDVFVTKLDPAGSSLVYSTLMGGSDTDLGWGLALLDGDEALVVGSTESLDFPTTAGAFDTSHNGGLTDAFVARLAADGSALVYSTYLGGSGIECDLDCDVAAGPDGTAYLTGVTFSEDFPTTAGAFQPEFAGPPFGTDAFVARLAADGSSLVWSTYLGGGETDFGLGLAVGPDGSAHVSGRTFSSDFPTTAGAFDTTCGGCPSFDDGFLVRLAADGSALAWSTFLGGSLGDRAAAVALAGDGAAFVTGHTLSDDFPVTPGAFDTTFNGGGFLCFCDAFVARVAPDGRELDYATYLGGADDDDFGHAVAASEDGTAVVVGEAWSSDFPVTADAFDPAWGRFVDAFVSRLAADGSTLLYSTFLGGEGPLCKHEVCRVDQAFAVAVDTAGAAVVTGQTSTTDFPVSAGAFDPTCGTDGACDPSGGFPATDAFAVRLSPGLPVLRIGRLDAGFRAVGGGFTVGFRALVGDETGAPVADAQVLVEVTPPAGGTRTVTLTTGADGTARLVRTTTATGTYTFTVLEVSKPGAIHDPAADVETTETVLVG